MLLVFPEGTRSICQPINPLKPGFALIAKRAQAPLQPIFLRTNSPYLSKDWKIWRPPQFPLIYQARLDTVLPVPESTHATVDLLQNRYLQAMHCAIDPNLTL
jgi:1-acyl-sn-glycerol-3-phosphate acyltransferase